jgi:hypothetical protein
MVLTIGIFLSRTLLNSSGIHSGALQGNFPLLPVIDFKTISTSVDVLGIIFIVVLFPPISFAYHGLEVFGIIRLYTIYTSR